MPEIILTLKSGFCCLPFCGPAQARPENRHDSPKYAELDVSSLIFPDFQQRICSRTEG